jgi:ketosteroid isomerase-like protein
MSLSSYEIEKSLIKWNLPWDKYDLEGVMTLFHEEVVFNNLTGRRIRGKEALRKAWKIGTSPQNGMTNLRLSCFIFTLGQNNHGKDNQAGAYNFWQGECFP